MQRLLTVLMVLFFSASCGEKIPTGVISQKQMPAVLVDIHLADGQMASMPIDSARAHRNAYYQSIFERYRIDSTVFRQSVEFYSRRPQLMNELYTNVEKRLEAMNNAEQKAIEEKYRVRQQADSIRNARQLDSLRRLTRDSLDFKRKRYLLFLNAPDSLYGSPDPVTYEKLRDRMLETIGLENTMPSSHLPATLRSLPPAPPKPSPKEQKSPMLRPFEKIK